MRILKRTKRGNTYYYLQHSYRIKDRVFTKEKYLGKQIPKNVDGIKKMFLDSLHKIGLFKLFSRIKVGFQKEWKTYPESMKEKLKRQISVDFTYNTNAIEGSTITLAETEELVDHNIAPNKPLNEIKETEAHAKAFLSMLSKGNVFNTDLIQKWHQELFRQTKNDISGKYRDYLVRVGGYVAPDWQDIDKMMKKLVEFYDTNSRMNAVELAARMHYKFEKIHPFGDGNGRVGRMIMNYILWHNKYPILVIEYKKRKSYYKALQKNEDGFFNYFARRYLKAHEKYLKGEL